MLYRSRPVRCPIVLSLLPCSVFILVNTNVCSVFKTMKGICHPCCLPHRIAASKGKLLSIWNRPGRKKASREISSLNLRSLAIENIVSAQKTWFKPAWGKGKIREMWNNGDQLLTWGFMCCITCFQGNWWLVVQASYWQHFADQKKILM